mmetsp:Transcript_88669/g.250973  ORF Transcript_88669/g.250973 Transcript_88669/m.250973 type:complete len:204 (-) Transcript_88669:149-760(-)
MLEADGHEARDGEPDAHHLANHVLRLALQEHRHAHQPVAPDSLEEGDPKVLLDLLLRNLAGKRGSQANVQVAGCDEASEEQGAKQIAHPSQRERPQDLHPVQLALKHRGRHGRRCACDQHPTCEEDEQQVHREERSEYKGLNGRVVLGRAVQPASHHHRQHAPEANVATRVERLVEDLDGRIAAHPNALVHHAHESLLRGLND